MDREPPQGPRPDPMTTRFLIGIDLGTTNSAVAFVDLSKKSRSGQPEIQPFPIPQLVAAGELGERPLLPSFLYLPGEHDLPPGATILPWHPGGGRVVGLFARDQGARIPGRLVTSAKSWLCHAGVDRSAALLPWSAPPDVPRISPVEASSAYLEHLVKAWNQVMAQGHPERAMEKQLVVLTVPASFDNVARTLTVEAARKAGLEHLTLLEEPQAAFYGWLATHSATEAALLKPGSRCVVVDVGGGTTDFSLIDSVEEKGELGFVRQAVGDHLLLGGDNMDLALAQHVETRLKESGQSPGRLDAAQYAALTYSCRTAKEILLAPNPPASYTVTVMGRGRSILGSTVRYALTPQEVHKVLFDGFFPHVPADATPTRGGRSGLHEMGLPYVSDPGITRHLASFLKQHAGDGRPNAATSPEAILFNGGVFQPASLREHLVQVMHTWYDRPGQPWSPLLLTNPSLDLAVAWGATYFAWLKHSGGKRIGGGIARSYYVAVAAESGAAESSTLDVLCVVPRHLEEGHEVTLAKPELELVLGQPVVFPLYTSTVRGEDHAGDLLHLHPEQLLQLPPLRTILRGGKRAGTKTVPVTLAARSTEIGTLEVFCVAKEGENRWRLEFNVRDLIKEEPAPSAGETALERSVTDVWPEAPVQAAARLIRATYLEPEGAEGAVKPQELIRSLEPALEAPRHEWPTGLCRRLWDFLAEVGEHRRRSPAHSQRWLNLVGYCLRPGFGDPLDGYRVEQLWKLMHAIPRGAAPPTQQAPAGAGPRPVLEGGSQYWILWRRVAGGLQTSYQRALAERLRPVLLPGKGKGALKPGADELAEMWRTAASLERLDSKQKETLGQTLLRTLKRSPIPPYAFWALTRFGARVLLYGPLNTIVHPDIVAAWLDALLPFQPGNESERLAWAFCLAQLARRSGQRALDVDESHQRSVLNALRSMDVPAPWLDMVEKVTVLESEEQSQMFGESLPMGLRLVQG